MKNIFLIWNKWIKENKIILHTEPDYYGADIEGNFANIPIKNISLKYLTGFEPDEKMQQSDAINHVKKLLKKLNSGDDLPPILVRQFNGRFQILDGHHRFQAYKLANRTEIPAKIIPPENITSI